MIDTAAIPRKPYKLDQLGSVGRGKSRHRPRDDERLYGGAYPFFQTGDVKAANFLLTRYSQTYNEFGLAQSKLWDPGTLCITIAANIAETAILGISGCFPDSVVGFVADPVKADTRFIKYYVDTIKLQMQSVSRGTTQDNLSVDKLLSFDFLVPCLSEQRRIAGILSAYDDLIENCQRRIRILEDMARGLYREWFVNFRFPDADAVPLVDSPLGRIPLGWSVKSLGALTSYVSRGIAPAYDEDGLSLVLNQKCIRDQRVSLSPARRQSKGIPSDKLIQFGDVLINSTGVGTLGRVAQVLVKVENCTVDTHVTLARPSAEVDLHYFGQMLQFQQPEFERLGVGATGQTELSRSAVTGTAVAAPPHELQCRFGALVQGMRLQAVGLAERCVNLRCTRDLLLPRLLSGQISLGEAAEQIQVQTQGTGELAAASFVG